MSTALYDDRVVRSHVRRTRDLISTASIHSSLSTALAMEYEAKQAGAAGGFTSPLIAPDYYILFLLVYKGIRGMRLLMFLSAAGEDKDTKEKSASKDKTAGKNQI